MKKKFTPKEKTFLFVVFEEINQTTWDCKVSSDDLKLFKKFYPEAIKQKDYDGLKTTVVNFSKLDPNKYQNLYIEYLKNEIKYWSDKCHNIQLTLARLAEE